MPRDDAHLLDVLRAARLATVCLTVRRDLPALVHALEEPGQAG